MALQIIENNNTFELHGTLNTATSKSFLNHVKLLMAHTKEMTLSIDHLSFIDESGVGALKHLLTEAFRQHLKFSIIGYGCKDIYDEFKSALAA
ncbi:STAS domain-containing protein [Psychroserpens sp. XS_ASV72]|uniref:STAS domain-containing protein n=1 Tax=Psychroserpens sp. XS_ASV72 TaxID=3241293 RepID=UPI003511C85D